MCLWLLPFPVLHPRQRVRRVPVPICLVFLLRQLAPSVRTEQEVTRERISQRHINRRLPSHLRSLPHPQPEGAQCPRFIFGYLRPSPEAPAEGRLCLRSTFGPAEAPPGCAHSLKPKVSPTFGSPPESTRSPLAQALLGTEAVQYLRLSTAAASGRTSSSGAPSRSPFVTSRGRRAAPSFARSTSTFGSPQRAPAGHHPRSSRAEPL